MASQTLSSVADTFPVGTSVGAYLASGWSTAALPPSGAPVPSATATATVASDGSLAFTGLADAATYYAGASISGTWRYRRFSTPPVTSSGTAPDASDTVKGIVLLAGDLAGTADAPTVPGKLAKASNLSDLASASTARTNLGLGTAATSASSAFAAASHTHVKADVTDLWSWPLGGDGSDGAAVFDGTTAVAGYTLAATVYTQTRNVYFSSITCSGTFTIKPTGYAILCQSAWTLPAGGTISFDGANGGNTGAAGGSITNLFGNINGGPGAVGTGSNGSAGVLGGAGGAGGAGNTGGSNAGGNGGTIPASTVQTIAVSLLRNPSVTLGGQFVPGGNAVSLKGGGGGGGGGGDATNKGGAGGSSGGVIVICAPGFTNNGTISAKGGNGGSPTTGIDGGGGGGGGGCVLVYTKAAATMGTINVAGGTKGTHVGTGGVDGTDGSAGWSQNVVLA